MAGITNSKETVAADQDEGEPPALSEMVFRVPHMRYQVVYHTPCHAIPALAVALRWLQQTDSCRPGVGKPAPGCARVALYGTVPNNDPKKARKFMATIYKRAQDHGKRRAPWYIGYTDHNGRRRTGQRL